MSLVAYNTQRCMTYVGVDDIVSWTLERRFGLELEGWGEESRVVLLGMLPPVAQCARAHLKATGIAL